MGNKVAVYTMSEEELVEFDRKYGLKSPGKRNLKAKQEPVVVDERDIIPKVIGATISDDVSDICKLMSRKQLSAQSRENRKN